MSRFQEITERYKEQMRNHQEQHLRRLDEIETTRMMMNLAVLFVVFVFLIMPFIAVWVKP